ncbi:rhodanese-like domain-containing protein [Flavobacteriales bacterium]|nr:rhodanese-like domain-containing protein [Flavobacteriales bacterium]MDB2317295.1 rhodanese-like domain-containing protein [Flavobacteriales bacterium]
MKLIEPKELKKKLKDKENIQLIDIREPYEYEDGALCNENIPLDKMMTSTDRISIDKPVIIYCRTSRRSSSIIYMLEKKFNFKNLYCLVGGYSGYMEDGES